MQEYILEHIFTIVTSLLGGGSLLGWFFERRKRKIQESKETAEALKTMQDAYNTFTEDSLKRYEGIKEDLLIVKSKLGEVTKQLNEEKNRYIVLERDHRALEENYEILKKQLIENSN